MNPASLARRPLSVAAAASAFGLLLAGCTSAVSVASAPHAADPACASVVLALPEVLGDLELLDTTSQASAAWGSPEAAVVLRCGVDAPPPTTDRCVTVETPGGPSVDWVTVAGEPDADGATDWTFTTYGREPAVELLVPATVTAGHSTSFVDQLGPAIALVEPTRSCL
ncbi:DUF3515 domain-containing protein [Cellulomonas chengniuliangii]|uniref:DUF3515 domain-containing protein n=1 Tax=Cellulomonas chengniuliangii TaxID=2968084 RepID=UPI001D0EACA3|nr:DUF3515 domain-containing protein [Cellulomonas chengniuliangii]MCC2318165.1 DUF3515 domain-containing protein [Cellulomonas chengniuliangii]